MFAPVLWEINLLQVEKKSQKFPEYLVWQHATCGSARSPSLFARHTANPGDEPTRGLHFQDITVLANSLRQLLTGLNTIIVIEHNFQFLQYADYRVKMGPGAGHQGGQILPQNK